MEFSDFNNVEFGICHLVDEQEIYLKVSIDFRIKEILCEMRNTFYSEYNIPSGEYGVFEPSEKYAGTERITTTLGQDYLGALAELYNNNNIEIAGIQLIDIIENIQFYFAIFTYGNEKEVAFKRSSQFKGLLKNRNKLISLIDSSLQSMDSTVFRLDKDFDFIIHGDIVKILHPTGFIYLTNMDNQILAAAGVSALEIEERISCIHLQSMVDFISTSKTAAKLIASIKSRDDLEQTNENKLLQECNILGIEIQQIDGRISPLENQEISFLQLLDRRQYMIDLTNNPEVYVASSRNMKQ